MGKIKELQLDEQKLAGLVEQITDDFIETWGETLNMIIHSTIPELDWSEAEIIQSKVYENIMNQRVIEELERLKSDCDAEDDAYSFLMSKAHQNRIKELKQD